jgi:hypothetical protein
MRGRSVPCSLSLRERDGVRVVRHSGPALQFREHGDHAFKRGSLQLG